MTKQVHYSWQEFNEAMDTIANRIKTEGHLQRIKCIYGIPRGGLVIAVKLSHMLDLPLATLAEVVAYGHTLIVDDIIDSGNTLSHIGKLAACTATIHRVPGAMFVPDIWVEERAKNAWVIYPWEV